jgi:acyl-CoA reductase-like NAD-dependent aldehyde dehydrogenase
VSGFPGGFFIEPTALADVTNDMRIAREEIRPGGRRDPFDETDAVALANDSEFDCSSI